MDNKANIIIIIIIYIKLLQIVATNHVVTNIYFTLNK